MARGNWDRRHGTKDRRVSRVSQRLRKGLWLEFHRLTETGKFDKLRFSQKTRNLLFAAFVSEACRYRFCDRAAGMGIDPVRAVEITLDILCLEWSQDRTDRFAIRVIEDAAHYMTSHFNVTKIDRREETRRQE